MGRRIGFSQAVGCASGKVRSCAHALEICRKHVLRGPHHWRASNDVGNPARKWRSVAAIKRHSRQPRHGAVRHAGDEKAGIIAALCPPPKFFSAFTPLACV